MAPIVAKRPLWVMLSASRSAGGSVSPRRAWPSSAWNVSLIATNASIVSASRTERAFSRALRRE